MSLTNPDDINFLYPLGSIVASTGFGTHRGLVIARRDRFRVVAIDGRLIDYYVEDDGVLTRVEVKA